MNNVYAVINPITQLIIGYVQTTQQIEKPLLVESFSIDTVEGKQRKLLDTLLSNDEKIVSQFDPKIHCDIDIKNETCYWIILNGQNIPVVRDTSTVKKLKSAMLNLNIEKEVKDLLTDLALNKHNFILKSMKEKPRNKIRLGDVVIYDGSLYYITDHDYEYPIGQKIISMNEISNEHIKIKDESVFRVGRSAFTS